jgi:hypothetical protein
MTRIPSFEEIKQVVFNMADRLHLTLVVLGDAFFKIIRTLLAVTEP